jgi:hypothetical protein
MILRSEHQAAFELWTRDEEDGIPGKLLAIVPFGDHYLGPFGLTYATQEEAKTNAKKLHAALNLGAEHPEG